MSWRRRIYLAEHPASRARPCSHLSSNNPKATASMGPLCSDAIIAYTDSYIIGLLLDCASHSIALMRGTSELDRKARLLLYLLAEATVYIIVCFPRVLKLLLVQHQNPTKYTLCQHEAYTYTLSLSYHRYIRIHLPSTGPFFNYTVPSPCLSA